MIYTCIPYASSEHSKDLGWAYNDFMQNLSDQDWACFLDHDAMFTVSDWYCRLERVIENNPEVGAFGCRTNRVANTYQLLGGVDIHNHDIEYHRRIGEQAAEEFKGQLSIIDDSTYQDGFSGVFILISKNTWKRIEGFKQGQFLSVDNDLRHRLSAHSIKFATIDEIYVYHWYRAHNPYPHSVKILDGINSINKKHNNIFLYKK